MTEPTPPGWFPVCPAAIDHPNGRRYRCWLESDHTDPHLALDEDLRQRIRWTDR